MHRFEDQVAVVTGAGRGIGQAVALRLAAEGASVVVVDLDEKPAAETVALIRQSGGVARAHLCDVSNAGAVDALFEDVASAPGRLGCLVTCAGVIRDNLVHKLTEQDWDTVVDTHLKGTFLCARAAQRVMVPQGGGKMVFISSLASRGNRGQANYSAAKAGIEGLARTLALELGRFGINVNVVSPGFVVSRMTRSVAVRTGVDYEDLKRSIADQSAVRRVGEPSDIASVVAFFCSSDADYVTGQTLLAGGNP